MKRRGRTSRERLAADDLMRASKALHEHSATIQNERRPERLRQIAEFVRNCATWIEWSADKLTTPSQED